jgi:transposase
MLRRGEITDQAWHQIEPLLPRYGQSGGQWRDHRTIVNGILWKLRTGSPWRDLPERYGPWQRPASIASTAGGATAPGIAFWPTPRPRATRSGM